MKKGFTLLELLVVILIIGVLSAFTIPSLFKGVERSRLAEAELLLGNVANAQNRYFMRMGKYAENWRALDNSPQDARSGTSYYTKSTSGSSFRVDIEGGDVLDAKATATRINSQRYEGYELIRFYRGSRVYCKAPPNHKEAEEMCIEFGTEDIYIDPTASMASEAATYTGV